jgi:hypothetical protein
VPMFTHYHAFNLSDAQRTLPPHFPLQSGTFRATRLDERGIYDREGTAELSGLPGSGVIPRESKVAESSIAPVWNSG